MTEYVVPVAITLAIAHLAGRGNASIHPFNVSCVSRAACCRLLLWHSAANLDMDAILAAFLLQQNNLKEGTSIVTEELQKNDSQILCSPCVIATPTCQVLI
jgi:hypothetical protein